MNFLLGLELGGVDVFFQDHRKWPEEHVLYNMGSAPLSLV